MGVTTAIALGTAAAGLYGAKKDSDTAKRATKKATQQAEASREYINRQTEQARGDIFKLFPSAQQSRQQGIQAGMNVLSDTMPAQLQAFQQGNMGAQQMVSQGLPQVQNAIFGAPINQAAFQPQQLGIQVPPSLASPQPLNFESIGAMFPQGGGIAGGAQAKPMAPGGIQSPYMNYLSNNKWGRGR